ncbi:hypothetical protein LY76DRAFT_596231 [Colletotrichum caudatum]|nr:hypothetical protein LY76DRAFT_596231 [Colletotrichum caudatum]
MENRNTILAGKWPGNQTTPLVCLSVCLSASSAFGLTVHLLVPLNGRPGIIGVQVDRH